MSLCLYHFRTPSGSGEIDAGQPSDVGVSLNLCFLNFLHHLCAAVEAMKCRT